MDWRNGEKMKDSVIQKRKIIENVDILIIIVTLLSGCVLFDYSDFGTLTVWSVEIWDSLFTGRLNEYFLVTAENLRKAVHGGSTYGIAYLIPWAIWNFPIWLTHFWNENYNVFTPICLAWSKLFLVICAVFNAVFVGKTVHLFVDDHKLSKYAFIFSLGAVTLYISVGYAGQDEIVYMMCMMAGLYYLLRRKKILGLFFLGLSVILCPFMLVPILAVLFIIEKNLLKIGLYILFYTVPNILLSHLCGISDVAYIAQTGIYKLGEILTINTHVRRFFARTTFSTGFGSVSAFALLIVFVYIRCYFVETYDNDSKMEFSLLFYPSILLSVGIGLFAWFHFYRHYITVPLLVCTVIVSGKKKEDVESGLFLLAILEFLRFFVNIQNTNAYEFRPSLLRLYFNQHGNWETLYTLLETYIPKVASVGMIIYSCYFALTIYMNIYSGWSLRQKLNVKIPLNITRIIYIALSPMVLAIYIYCWFTFNVSTYTLNTNEDLAVHVNQENSLWQMYTPQGSHLDFIEIQPIVKASNSAEVSQLYIELVDGDSGRVVAKKSAFANALSQNAVYRISFDGIRVKPGYSYYLHFYINQQNEQDLSEILLLQSDIDTAEKAKQFAVIETDEISSELEPCNVLCTVAERR